MNRKILALIVVTALALSGFVFLYGINLNLNQELAFESAIANSSISFNQAVQNLPHQPNADSLYGTLSVTIFHAQDTTPRSYLISEGFTPSCLVLCRGIYYFHDPTTLITNDGRDFEQCKVFGSAGTITCVAADTATVTGVSASATTPAAADTYSSGPCSSTNIITTNGLTPVAGTVTAGAAGSTVTTTVVNTFTDATAQTASVQVGCLLTELTSGSHIYVYMEGQFGPDTLNVGDTLQLTFSIART